MALDDIYNYFQSYDKTTFVVFAQQGHEPSAADIAAFEARVGFALPDEFREYAVHPLGGLYMEVREELWPRPKAGDVGPFWSFLYGLLVYGLSPEAPELLQMAGAWEDMSQDGSPHLVPFLKIIGDADPYCFTAEQKIVIWRHEEPDDPEEVNESFSEVLMREIRELESRRDQKLSGKEN